MVFVWVRAEKRGEGDGVCRNITPVSHGVFNAWVTASDDLYNQGYPSQKLPTPTHQGWVLTYTGMFTCLQGNTHVMPLCARTGPVLGRYCQHRASTGPVLARKGMFTGTFSNNDRFYFYWTCVFTTISLDWPRKKKINHCSRMSL